MYFVCWFLFHKAIHWWLVLKGGITVRTVAIHQWWISQQAKACQLFLMNGLHTCRMPLVQNCSNSYEPYEIVFNTLSVNRMLQKKKKLCYIISAHIIGLSHWNIHFWLFFSDVVYFVGILWSGGEFFYQGLVINDSYSTWLHPQHYILWCESILP